MYLNIGLEVKFWFYSQNLVKFVRVLVFQVKMCPNFGFKGQNLSKFIKISVFKGQNVFFKMI